MSNHSAVSSLCVLISGAFMAFSACAITPQASSSPGSPVRSAVDQPGDWSPAGANIYARRQTATVVPAGPALARPDQAWSPAAVNVYARSPANIAQATVITRSANDGWSPAGINIYGRNSWANSSDQGSVANTLASPDGRQSVAGMQR